jgi:hypothetical protein
VGRGRGDGRERDRYRLIRQQQNSMTDEEAVRKWGQAGGSCARVDVRVRRSVSWSGLSIVRIEILKIRALRDF